MDANTSPIWFMPVDESRFFIENGVPVLVVKNDNESDGGSANKFRLTRDINLSERIDFELLKSIQVGLLRPHKTIDELDNDPSQEDEDNSPELTNEELNELLKSIGLNKPQRATMSEIVNTLAGEGTVDVYYLDTEKAIAFRNSNNDVIRIFGETENFPLEIHIDLYRTDHFSNLLINSRLSVEGNLEGVAFVSYADTRRTLKECDKYPLSKQADQLLDLVFSQ